MNQNNFDWRGQPAKGDKYLLSIMDWINQILAELTKY